MAIRPIPRPLLHQGMVCCDRVVKRLGDLIPRQQIHPKRQIAFVKGFFEVGDRHLLLWGGKHHQTQVRVGAGILSRQGQRLLCQHPMVELL